MQYSKAAGFETIAITHSKDQEKIVRDLGADEVIADGEALQKMGGADVILVTGNFYKSASAALKGLRPDGRMVLMGISEEPLELTGDIITNCSRIIGSMQNGDEYLYEGLDYVAKGKVKVISETYSLNDISQVYDRVANGEVRFRAVITDM